MNGADSLMQALIAGGIDVCFANPGTSEMHFVAALDQTPGMRGILGLFEGTVTGAADGYARMTGRPAVTLLHLGPGMANGLSNLHNAIRAQSPIVNVVGDHAVAHRHLDAPLTSDIEGAARPFSDWVRTTPDAASVAIDTASAIREARRAPGRIATLILPADAAWSSVPGDTEIPRREVPTPRPLDGPTVEAVAATLSGTDHAAILLGPGATLEEPLNAAAKVASATGSRLLAPTMTSRISRGAGRPVVERIPYALEEARQFLADVEVLVLVGAKPPVSFFAYPDRPGLMYQPGATILELAASDQDVTAALDALVDAVGAASESAPLAEFREKSRPDGSITPAKLGVLIGAMVPENAIIIDESITTGRTIVSETEESAPHDLLVGTGGSIGYAMPCAVGAAVACPDRKVIALESDGSAMYQPQALWTMAREGLDVLVLIFANRKYAILHHEMRNVGVPEFGPKANALLDIDTPTIDWVALASSMGVSASAAGTMDELATQIDNALSEPGPRLIEVRLG